MNEIYAGGAKKPRLTPSQIRKMKENMRKVPEIQKKSESFHQKEAEKADQLLEQVWSEKEEQYLSTEKKTSGSRYQSLIEKIKAIFISLIR